LLKRHLLKMRLLERQLLKRELLKRQLGILMMEWQRHIEVGSLSGCSLLGETVNAVGACLINAMEGITEAVAEDTLEH
jgi:hypothetical protein